MREHMVKRKASPEKERKLFIENLSREKFCKILDGLPSTFRFKLTNVRDDFDGYWEKTILDGKTAWRKDDKVLLSQFLFAFREEVCVAIDREIGAYYKAKRNWEGIRKILFSDEAMQILTKKKGEITLILTKEKIKTLYFKQNKSLEDIAKEYGCSRTAIMKIMKKYRLVRRTQSKARIEAMKKGKFERFGYYEINENFFSEWSPEMAWVLGLLFTDGFIRPSRISIWSMDIELLEKVKKTLNSSNPIRITAQSYDKSKHIHTFGFYREKMMEDLNRLGLHQKKSLNMIFPKVPEEYIRHFIRGCWDGDGSIYFESKKLRGSYTCGSFKFIEKLVQELYRAEIYKRTPPSDKSERDKMWSNYPDGRFPLKIHEEKRSKSYYIKIDSKDGLEKLFHYLYDGVDESIYLSRKYNTFVKGLKLEKNETGQLTLDLEI